MTAEKIKFTQGYDDAFLGAEGWGEDAAPFIAYADEWVIIVDAAGISLIANSDDDLSEWNYSEKFSYFTAKQLVKSVENNNIEEMLAITVYGNPDFKRVN